MTEGWCTGWDRLKINYLLPSFLVLVFWWNIKHYQARSKIVHELLWMRLVCGHSRVSPDGLSGQPLTRWGWGHGRPCRSACCKIHTAGWGHKLNFTGSHVHAMTYYNTSHAFPALTHWAQGWPCRQPWRHRWKRGWCSGWHRGHPSTACRRDRQQSSGWQWWHEPCSDGHRREERGEGLNMAQPPSLL